MGRVDHWSKGSNEKLCTNADTRTTSHKIHLTTLEMSSYDRLSLMAILSGGRDQQGADLERVDLAKQRFENYTVDLEAGDGTHCQQ